MGQKDLDRLVDQLRGGSVDLSYLNGRASDAQIDAMVKVVQLHSHDSPDISDIGNCTCGWKMNIVGKHWDAIEYAYLRHIMVDIMERVFARPVNPLTGR